MQPLTGHVHDLLLAARRRVFPLTIVRTGVIALSLLFCSLTWCVADAFVEDDNFRAVSPMLFRSGQLRVDEWNESFAAFPYRSVINLRGENPQKHWYRVEQRFAAEHALTHYDFELSSRSAPSMAKMEALIGLMRAAPKPLLIHCNAGSDRTGLAAALYVYAVDGGSAADAAEQLSLWFGHFPWLTSRTGAMDAALAQYIGTHKPGAAAAL